MYVPMVNTPVSITFVVDVTQVSFFTRSDIAINPKASVWYVIISIVFLSMRSLKEGISFKRNINNPPISAVGIKLLFINHTLRLIMLPINIAAVIMKIWIRNVQLLILSNKLVINICFFVS